MSNLLTSLAFTPTQPSMEQYKKYITDQIFQLRQNRTNGNNALHPLIEELKGESPEVIAMLIIQAYKARPLNVLSYSILFFQLKAKLVEPDKRYSTLKQIQQLINSPQIPFNLFLSSTMFLPNPVSGVLCMFDDLGALQDLVRHETMDWDKLIDIAATYGSIHCFRFLKINGGKVQKPELAVQGGRVEIITILDQEGYNFSSLDCLNAAIKYHRNNVVKWLVHTREFKCDVSLSTALESFNLKALDLIPVFELTAGLHYFRGAPEVFGDSLWEYALTKAFPKLTPFWIAEWIREYLGKECWLSHQERMILKLFHTHRNRKISYLTREPYMISFQQ